MIRFSQDELLRFAARMAQDVISEMAVTDSAIDLLIHDDSVSLETRGKLSLLIEQVRAAAAPAERFIMLSRTKDNVCMVVDLNDFFSDLSRLLRALLPANIDFKIELASDLWSARVDVGQFEQVFITLFAHARDGMPNGGDLLFRVANVDETTARSISGLCLAGDHVLIEVTDSGVAIPPARLKHIFHPFALTKELGCGFGLAKVYWTIKDTGGHISVKSEVGRGNTFSVLVPRYVAEQVTHSS